MSDWLYAPVTIHLEKASDGQKSQNDVLALGGIYLYSKSSNNYYFIAVSTVPNPERYSFKFTCPLMITTAVINWTPLKLEFVKYLKDEPSKVPVLNPFVMGLTLDDQFIFKPYSKQHISILSLKFASPIEPQKRPFFDPSLLSSISFHTGQGPSIPSRVVIQCCPFSLTNVAIFANYKMFGSINYSISGAGYLTDAKYLDDSIGGIVNLEPTGDSRSEADVSLGLVCGTLTKVNGDGELMLIISWSKILQLLPYKDLLEENFTGRSQFQDTHSSSHEATDPINSCARISVTTSNGSFWGSGIVISNDTIATNLHVLKLNDIKDVHVSFPNNTKLVLNLKDFRFERTPLTGFDLCFMRLRDDKTRLPNPVKICNTFINALKSGQRVRSIGYGLFYTKSLRELRPFHSNGFINTVVQTPLDNPSYREDSLLLVSASCWNGSSGGGLFNESNELVGILTSNGKLSTGEILPNFTLAIPINVIEKSLFMLENGLGPIDAEEQIQNLWSLRSTHDNVIYSHGGNDYKL